MQEQTKTTNENSGAKTEMRWNKINNRVWGYGQVSKLKRSCVHEREREDIFGKKISLMDTIFKFPGQLPDLITHISIESNFNPLDK